MKQKRTEKKENSSNNVWYGLFQWIFKIKKNENRSKSVDKTSYKEKESADPLPLGNWNMSILISW